MGATILAKKQLRLGIIGPGDLTDHMIQSLRLYPTCVNKVDSITFFDHCSANFSRTYNGQVDQMFKFLNPTPKHSKTDNFFEFMDQSDVVIYNVGGFTPERIFRRKTMQVVNNFPELEGILESEAQKIDVDPTHLITGYHVLKELTKLSVEEFPKDAWRIKLLFPMILSKTKAYAERMRDYFTDKRVNPREKLLIVTANSSENNLDAFLSYIPEWQETAVSLAIDRNRLIALFNRRYQNELGELILSRVTMRGDHDGRIIPSYKLTEFRINNEEEKRRVQRFRDWLSSSDGLKTIHEELDCEVHNYAKDRMDTIDIGAHAGEGVVDIIRSVLEDGFVASSGYFHELGEKYGLKKGEGLTFVGDHKIEWNGKTFKVIPQPQKLDSIAEELFEQCKREHINLHQRLVSNPHIPVPGFPGTKEAGSFHGSSAVEIIDTYNREKRLHTELVVPMYDPQLKHDAIVAIDLNNLSRRELEFGQYSIRTVKVLEIDGEQKLACGFATDCVIVDPKTFRIEENYHFDIPKNPGRHQINSIAANENHIYISHGLGGVVAIDLSNKKQKIIADGSVDKIVTGITINQGKLYYAQGKDIVEIDRDGNEKRYTNHLGFLTEPVFDNERGFFYTTVGKKIDSLDTAVWQGVIGHPKRDLRKLDFPSIKFRGGMINLLGYGENEEFHLIFSHKNEVYELVVNDKCQVQNRFITDSKVEGLAHQVHTYATDKPREVGNKIYEYDHSSKLVRELSFNDSRYKLAPTLVILNTQR